MLHSIIPVMATPHPASCQRLPFCPAVMCVNVVLACLCSSLANARDVGEWLGASGHATFNFAPGVRPVPLEIHMHGLDIHNFEARMQVSRDREGGFGGAD